MNNDITTNGNAYMNAVRRPNHLAVVQGGGPVAEAATIGGTRVAGGTPTGYSRPAHAASSPQETGVRAVARMYDNFEDAVLPMVLASGVSGDTAERVAQAIMNVPALRKQAEGAFRAARIEAV